MVISVEPNDNIAEYAGKTRFIRKVMMISNIPNLWGQIMVEIWLVVSNSSSLEINKIFGQIYQLLI